MHFKYVTYKRLCAKFTKNPRVKPNNSQLITSLILGDESLLIRWKERKNNISHKSNRDSVINRHFYHSHD